MERFSKQELILFTGLFLLGSFLRLWALNMYPAGFHGDEAITGLEAKRILEQGNIGLWSPGALGQATLSFYWTALVFKFLGESIFSARLSLTLLNIISIPFFYLTAKIVFGRNVAIISTFLIITSGLTLAFARRADLIAVNFSFFPAIYFFLLSLKQNKKIYFILSGIFIGLSHYVYASYWITPLIFSLFILYEITVFKKEFLKKYFKNIGILILSYLITAIPMLIFGITHPNDFFSRIQTISIFSFYHKIPELLQILLHNIQVTFLMFNFIPEADLGNLAYNSSVFDPITGIFFLVGFLYLLYQFKQGQNIYIIIFFLIFLSGSIFTIDAPSFRRSQGSIYIAYMFVGVGIITSFNLLLRKFSSMKKPLLLTTIILILSLGAYNTWFYFNNYATSKVTKSVYAYQLKQIANFVKTLPPKTYIYFYSSRWSYHYETLKFLLPNTNGEDKSIEFSRYSSNHNSSNHNVVYIFLPEYTNSLEEIKKLYPKGQELNHLDRDHSLLFTSYYLN